VKKIESRQSVQEFETMSIVTKLAAGIALAVITVSGAQALTIPQMPSVPTQPVLPTLPTVPNINPTPPSQIVTPPSAPRSQIGRGWRPAR
jgi:hypothetical protein